MTAGGWAYRPARQGLLGLDDYPMPPDHCRAVVVPFGLESALSYKGGAAAGAEALIAAGAEVEGFDEERGADCHRAYGVATLAPIAVAAGHDAALAQIETLVERLLAEGRFPLVVGGDHSLTIGAIRPFIRRWPDLAILQIDAHLDLRDEYMGSANSHACAMRRALDAGVARIVSVGARSMDASEWALAQGDARITAIPARNCTQLTPDCIATDLSGRPIYVSFDVDGLDSGIMPATGTPEPGGLSYREAVAIIAAAAGAGRIVGGDVVELAPIPGFHAADFTAARIAFEIINLALR